MLETYLRFLDEAYYEATFSFEGLADENVWRRPVPGLLSVGELAGHIAYWEAVKLAGDSGVSREELVVCRVQGSLIDVRFRYLPTTLATLPSEEHLAMTAERVRDELLRVHKESVADFQSGNPDLDATPPGLPPNHTYRAFLVYAPIHVAYHVGQMFTVRHLLGEETPDN